MRKTLALVLVALIAMCSVFAAGGSESTSASSDTYTIGFIGPLTGDNANYGIRCSNAARLAIDEINAAGGIDGKQLALIAENSLGTDMRNLSIQITYVQSSDLYSHLRLLQLPSAAMRTALSWSLRVPHTRMSLQ